MKAMVKTCKIAALSVVFFGISACNDNDNTDDKNFDFFLKNTAGGETLLDHTWYRECVPHTYLPDTWVDSQRTLSTNELAVTEEELSAATNLSDAEFIQCLIPQSSCGASLKICQRWAQLVAESTAIRVIKYLVSVMVVILSSSILLVKLGQPVPESNLSSEL